MLKITVIYSDKEQIKDIDETIKADFIDLSTSKGRKKGWTVKNHWAAKKDPFIIVEDNNKKVLNIFYSESENVINSLNKLYGSKN